MRPRSRAVAVLVAIVVTVLAGLWLLGGDRPGTSSALSADARGWLAARRYLEARGAEVRLRDVPFDGAGDDAHAAPIDGVLVLAFPWQRFLSGDELEAVSRHLMRGGSVVLAYSRKVEQGQEEMALDQLGLTAVELRPSPSLTPWEWWLYHREVWTLEPDDTWSADPPRVTVRAFRRAPEAPAGATVLYRAGADHRPVIFATTQNRGTVVVLPADVLANASLVEGDNADLLETLHAWLGPVWTFDEYHHGLTAPELADTTLGQFAWDAFFVHAVLIYLLAVGALARRFGPAWREAPVVAGSAAAFLRSLGALHRRLGHHRDAARLLDQRLRQLDPSSAVDQERPYDGITDDRAFLDFARHVSGR